jgi:hypothetical protein
MRVAARGTSFVARAPREPRSRPPAARRGARQAVARNDANEEVRHPQRSPSAAPGRQEILSRPTPARSDTRPETIGAGSEEGTAGHSSDSPSGTDASVVWQLDELGRRIGNGSETRVAPRPPFLEAWAMSPRGQSATQRIEFRRA